MPVAAPPGVGAWRGEWCKPGGSNISLPPSVGSDRRRRGGGEEEGKERQGAAFDHYARDDVISAGPAGGGGGTEERLKAEEREGCPTRGREDKEAAEGCSFREATAGVVTPAPTPHYHSLPQTKWPPD